MRRHKSDALHFYSRVIIIKSVNIHFIQIEFISCEDAFDVYTFWQLFRWVKEEILQNRCCFVYKLYRILSARAATHEVAVRRASKSGRLGEKQLHRRLRSVCRGGGKREENRFGLENNPNNKSEKPNSHWNFAHLSAYKSSYWFADNFEVDKGWLDTCGLVAGAISCRVNRLPPPKKPFLHFTNIARYLPSEIDRLTDLTLCNNEHTALHFKTCQKLLRCHFKLNFASHLCKIDSNWNFLFT